MPFFLKGHRMVTSSDQTKAYITGGFDGIEKMKSIYEMVCSSPDQCEFNKLNTEMKEAKAFHIAFPIDEDYANDMCANCIFVPYATECLVGK